MYKERVASLFNSEIINKTCDAIDQKHPESVNLKKTLLYLIRTSVDLSVRASYIKPYIAAYAMIQKELLEENKLEGSVLYE